MTDEENEFERQAEYLAKVHALADHAEALTDQESAATFLFSAALVSLNRLHHVDQALSMARLWADSLRAQEAQREATH